MGPRKSSKINKAKDMRHDIFNPGTTLEQVSGTVCGHNLVVIEDFNQIKCPICGECMYISGMDLSGDVDREHYIMTDDRFRDDYGVSHRRVSGRDKREEQQVIHMGCPNECVKDLALNVIRIAYGPYREFTEMRI